MTQQRDINDVYDEVEAKVAEAIKLLREANTALSKAGYNTQKFDSWSDLKEIVEEFIDLSSTDEGWTCSMW